MKYFILDLVRPHPLDTSDKTVPLAVPIMRHHPSGHMCGKSARSTTCEPPQTLWTLFHQAYHTSRAMSVTTKRISPFAFGTSFLGPNQSHLLR
jgi:hypothetical protein